MPKLLTLLFVSLSIVVSAQQTNTVWLDDLLIQTYSEGIRPVQAKSNYQHDTLRMNDVRYARGIGAQSPCVLAFLLDKHATHFCVFAIISVKMR